MTARVGAELEQRHEASSLTLKGRVAVVTGSTSGIGLGVAQTLAGHGAAVMLNGFGSPSAIAGVIADLSREHRVPVAHSAADMSTPVEIAEMVAQTERDLGPVDILINNAGITGPTGRADQLATGDWDKTLQTNLRTPFVLSRAVIPSMIERKTGRIINISSIAGKMAYPLRAPYAASKWGLVGLTLTLAQELGPYNVRVNVVCPGPTRTELIDSVIRARAAAAGVSVDEMFQEYVRATALKRMVLPEEVADVVLFLCSPESDAITGQAIDVSAGYGFRLGN